MVWFLRRWKIRKKRVLRRSKKHFLIAFLQNVRRSFKISSTSRFRSLCLFIVCRNSSGAGAYCKKRDRRAGHSSDHGLEHRKEEGLMPGTPLGTPLESSKPDTFRDFQRHRRTQAHVHIRVGMNHDKTILHGPRWMERHRRPFDQHLTALNGHAGVAVD